MKKIESNEKPSTAQDIELLMIKESGNDEAPIKSQKNINSKKNSASNEDRSKRNMWKSCTWCLTFWIPTVVLTNLVCY